MQDLPRSKVLKQQIFRVALLASILFAAGAQAAGTGIPLRLIAFNDFHGHLEPGNNVLALPDPDDPGKTVYVPTGGAPWLAGLIAQLRREATHAAVFSSGDLLGAAPLVSSLFRHEPTIQVMNAIGLDFGVVGNHEFDAGADELRRIARGGCGQDAADAAATSCATGAYRGAAFQLLAANVEGSDGRPIFPPLLVKEYGGIKVGFIGVVTRQTPAIVRRAGILGLSFRDEAATLNRYAAELKQQGVEAIVAVVHEGGAVGTQWNDTACAGAQGAIFDIAQQLSGDIDLVFSAHTHQGYNCVVDTPRQKGLRVIQATSYGRGVSVVDVLLDPASRDIDRMRTDSRNIAVVNQARGKYAAVPKDTRVAQLVAEFAELAAPKANRAVGSIVAGIGSSLPDGSREPADSAAGRLIADAQLAATAAPDAGGAQLALMNPGGIRATLPCATRPPCGVSYGQVFTAQPFGNNLVVMTLTGQQLKGLLEDQQKSSAKEARFLHPSRTLTYTWKRGAGYGERVADLRLNEVAVTPDVRYRVTVNNFLAEGGDGFRRLLEGSDRSGGMLDVDALAGFLQTHPGYAPDRNPRIRLAD